MSLRLFAFVSSTDSEGDSADGYVEKKNDPLHAKMYYLSKVYDKLRKFRVKLFTTIYLENIQKHGRLFP